MGKQKPLSLSRTKKKPFPKSLNDTKSWDLMDWAPVVLINNKKGFIAKKAKKGKKYDSDTFFLADSKRRVFKEINSLHYIKSTKRF